MNKATFIARMQAGEIVIVSRDRVYMEKDMITVPRKMFDQMYDADQMIVVRKVNVVSKAYKYDIT